MNECGISPRVEIWITVQAYLVTVVLISAGLFNTTGSAGYALFGISLTVIVLGLPALLLLRPKSTDDVYFIVWKYGRLPHFDHWDISASDDWQRLRIEMACRES